MNFWSQKVGPNILRVSIACHNRSFPSFGTQNHDMCNGAIGSNIIEIPIPYRLPMGSWLGIGASTIYAMRRLSGTNTFVPRKPCRSPLWTHVICDCWWMGVLNWWWTINSFFWLASHLWWEFLHFMGITCNCFPQKNCKFLCKLQTEREGERVAIQLQSTYWRIFTHNKHLRQWSQICKEEIVAYELTCHPFMLKNLTHAGLGLVDWFQKCCFGLTLMLFMSSVMKTITKTHILY